LQRFDPSRRIPFPAFATPTIEGALKRHYRDRGYQVRLPRKVQESVARVKWGREHLAAELGREPSAREVADLVNMSVEAIVEAEAGIRARRVASIDVLREGEPAVAAADPAFQQAEDRASVVQMMDVLSDREREVARLYYWEGWSQAAIAEDFGVCQMQVSRWLAAILRRLRAQAA
jgi:RNA polymerase sigma-B factor